MKRQPASSPASYRRPSVTARTIKSPALGRAPVSSTAAQLYFCCCWPGLSLLGCGVPWFCCGFGAGEAGFCGSEDERLGTWCSWLRALAIARSRGSHWPVYFRHCLISRLNILVSITEQSAHCNRMDSGAADSAINFSLWGLALLILSGTILAFLVW